MKSIMIVEDNERLLSTFQRILEGDSIAVYPAHDVRGALTIMDFTKIDVAIVDYKLPRISGDRLAKHITENSPDTKIYMISGYDQVIEALDNIGVTVNGVFKKPIDPRLLERIVKQVD